MERKYFVEGRWFDDAEKAYSFASVLAFKYCRDIEMRDGSKTCVRVAPSPTNIENIAYALSDRDHMEIDFSAGTLIEFEDNLLELHGIE